MNNAAFYRKPKKLIPFRWQGHQGKVAVYYGANTDPQWVGFNALPRREYFSIDGFPLGVFG